MGRTAFLFWLLQEGNAKTSSSGGKSRDENWILRSFDFGDDRVIKVTPPFIIIHLVHQTEGSRKASMAESSSHADAQGGIGGLKMEAQDHRSQLLEGLTAALNFSSSGKQLQTKAGLPTKEQICSEMELRYLTPKIKMESHLLSSSQM